MPKAEGLRSVARFFGRIRCVGGLVEKHVEYSLTELATMEVLLFPTLEFDLSGGHAEKAAIFNVRHDGIVASIYPNVTDVSHSDY